MLRPATGRAVQYLPVCQRPRFQYCSPPAPPDSPCAFCPCAVSCCRRLCNGRHLVGKFMYRVGWGCAWWCRAEWSGNCIGPLWLCRAERFLSRGRSGPGSSTDAGLGSSSGSGSRSGTVSGSGRGYSSSYEYTVVCRVVMLLRLSNRPCPA